MISTSLQQMRGGGGRNLLEYASPPKVGVGLSPTFKYRLDQAKNYSVPPALNSLWNICNLENFPAPPSLADMDQRLKGGRTLLVSNSQPNTALLPGTTRPDNQICFISPPILQEGPGGKSNSMDRQGATVSAHSNQEGCFCTHCQNSLKRVSK